MFHVETTAWEGEHAYAAQPEPGPEPPTSTEKMPKEQDKSDHTPFASYSGYFWSKK